MAIITFWNDNTGKTGQTYSAVAIATFMAIEHNYKILLISTEYGDQVALQAFGAGHGNKTIKFITGGRQSMDLESGIEGMMKMTSSNRLTPEMVPNYTKVILKKRLEILTGPKERPDIDYKKVFEACKSIISTANKYYDVVFVDLNHGLKEDTTLEILNISDIVIFNIEQKMSELEQMINFKTNKQIYNPKSSLILVNKYDRRSKYTTKNMTRELKETKEILSVPYCSLYSDSMQEGTVADFLLNPRIRKISDLEDRTGFFINELRRTKDAVIYRMQELQMRI